MEMYSVRTESKKYGVINVIGNNGYNKLYLIPVYNGRGAYHMRREITGTITKNEIVRMNAVQIESLAV